MGFFSGSSAGLIHGAFEFALRGFLSRYSMFYLTAHWAFAGVMLGFVWAARERQYSVNQTLKNIKNLHDLASDKFEEMKLTPAPAA